MAAEQKPSAMERMAVSILQKLITPEQMQGIIGGIGGGIKEAVNDLREIKAALARIEARQLAAEQRDAARSNSLPGNGIDTGRPGDDRGLGTTGS